MGYLFYGQVMLTLGEKVSDDELAEMMIGQVSETSENCARCATTSWPR